MRIWKELLNNPTKYSNYIILCLCSYPFHHFMHELIQVQNVINSSVPKGYLHQFLPFSASCIVTILDTTVESLLTATPDRRPPAYYGHSPWVQNASPFTTMLQKPLIYGHLSTPYNGHFSWPPSMYFNLCTKASPTHQLVPPTS